MLDDVANQNRRIWILAGSVFASLLVPILIVWAVSTIVFWQVPLGGLDRGNSITQYGAGGIKGDELWFPAYSVKQPPIMEVMKLNLKTGRVTATGLKIQTNYARVEWLGDDLYCHNATSIYRIKNDVVEQFPPLPVSSSNLLTNPFVYQGDLCFIDEVKPGNYVLLKLQQQKWVPAGEVLLPDCDKEVAARQTPEQRTRTALITKGTTQRRLTVRSDGHDLHLFLNHNSYISPDAYYAAYRKGLELVDNENKGAAATGWGDVSPSSGSGFFPEMCLDRDGPIFPSLQIEHGRERLHRLERRMIDGRLEPLQQRRSATDNDVVQYVHGPNVFVLASSESSYVMQSHGNWHGEEFCPIDNLTIEPPILKLPDQQASYVFSRSVIAASIPFAWFAHYLILLLGMARCRSIRDQYEFGNQVVTLAPISRRAVAQLIDVSLMVVMVGVSFWGHTYLLDVRWTPPKLEQFANYTFDIEQILLFRNQAAGWLTQFFGWLRLIPFLPMFAMRLQLFGTSPEPMMIAWAAGATIADTAAIIWCYQVYSEGRYGCTIGKWLCGIRTLRTTFRNVGFLRAILRDVLRYVDCPLFLTPLPASMSMMKSATCQRIGDGVADTIVVRDQSLRECTPGSDELSSPPETAIGLKSRSSGLFDSPV